jgi:threonine synthase
MRTLKYSDLAFEVISKFVRPSDIPSNTLRDIIERSFSTFRTSGIPSTFKNIVA